MRGEEQPAVGRQLPARHHRGRGPGRVRHGPPDRPPSRRDCRTHARGAEARARGSQHKHHEQGNSSGFFDFSQIFTIFAR